MGADRVRNPHRDVPCRTEPACVTDENTHRPGADPSSLPRSGRTCHFESVREARRLSDSVMHAKCLSHRRNAHGICRNPVDVAGKMPSPVGDFPHLRRDGLGSVARFLGWCASGHRSRGHSECTPLRRGHLATCIASRVEKRRPLPGDLIVPEPMFTVTHAITIDAPVERVWPWLAQMGYRAGRDSWDAIPTTALNQARRASFPAFKLLPG